ncbi:MAG: universal stress protein [Adlercreutzia equolifaciens]
MVDDAHGHPRGVGGHRRRHGEPHEVKVLKGTSPADLIVNCAKEEGCDLIIMGSRGQGGVKGFLGSVSLPSPRNRPVTVLIAAGRLPLMVSVCCQGRPRLVAKGPHLRPLTRELRRRHLS